MISIIAIYALCFFALFGAGYYLGNRFYIKRTVESLLRSVQYPLTLEGNQALIDLIENLKSKITSVDKKKVSAKDIIVGALTFLEWAIDERAKGRKIASVDAGDEGEEWKQNPDMN